MCQVFSDDSAFKEPNPPTTNGLDGDDGQTVVSVFYFFSLHVYCINHRCTPQLDHFPETVTVFLHQHNKTSRNVCAKTNFMKTPSPTPSLTQEGFAATKPMPIPTIDTSRSQVIDMQLLL